MNALRLLAASAVALIAAPVHAQSDLNDLQMAHVAVLAAAINIRYAHLALALSKSPNIKKFAETMIRDHTAVSGGVVALAKRLNVEAQDDGVSQKRLTDSEKSPSR